MKLHFFLDDNKIIFIDANVMSQLPNLQRLDLNRNLCIDGNSSLSSLSTFLEEVNKHCGTNKH